MRHETQRPTILVVDDRMENIRSMTRILEELDANVHYALSGVEALSLLLRHQFALILLDVMMPEMDGFETAELIRSHQGSQHIPIIFVTAADKEEAFEFKGYDVGAVDYLFKPVQPQILLSKVRFFLELSKHKALLEHSLLELRQLRGHQELLLKSTAEGILSLDMQGRVTFANPAAKRLLGYQDDELLGIHFAEVQGIEIASLPFEQSDIHLACLARRSMQDDQQWFQRRDGERFPVEFTASPINDQGPDCPGMVLVFQDISKRKRTEQQLAYLAQYDPLTGLANRDMFLKLLHQAISRSDRHQHSLALLFLDLDRFKQVNDTQGHEAGDELLKQAAQRLQSRIRDGDTISRLGGDEFTVILEEIGESRGPAIVAQKLIDALSEPFMIKGNEIFIGTSVGIALYPNSADNAQALLKCADMAMYQAKAHGRNNFQFFTSQMQHRVTRALDLENRLRHALDRQELLLHYQPQVDIASGQIIGLEALLRWQPEGQPMVLPGQFISIAEETGLIVPIGEWVLRSACTQIQQWHASGLLAQNVSVSVNLSVRQLENKSLLTTLEKILRETRLKPSQLELEITESAVMKDPEVAVNVLRNINQQGIQVSLDDFGTGYSSLSYLKMLPLDVLKIDRSFVNDIGGDPSHEAILKAIVSLSKNLNLRVVAEGVETEAQLTFLRQLHCHSIQGYFVSKPKSAEQIEELLRSAKQGCLPGLLPAPALPVVSSYLLPDNQTSSS
ncbi:putative bifunctional diguanylate cyclase/phosphodiesterase [Zobellella maritima]|uniref:putative bifunctional diguanylate cyclase/phosphodiesterase n=1 Tax=Zobellella maritima TaxID=2059725 RepID=UPI000E305038|nr:EAL domain-containing protein [Zobellella maritima]